VKAGKKHREIFEIFHEIFQGKKFHEILHHYSLPVTYLRLKPACRCRETTSSS